jgi:hypothetical protein
MAQHEERVKRAGGLMEEAAFPLSLAYLAVTDG